MSQLGVDTGGTFTDLVWIEGSDRSQVRTAKVPSQPADPSRAVLRGLSELDALGDHPPDITHGTTVALNALLTGRGARVAMVTNQGFLDLIEIGRQDRPELYALEPKKADALVPRQRRFEINQRSAPDSNGKVVRLSQPTAQQLDALRQAISQSDAESVAICLLHSYADPAIETEIGEALRELGLPITCSSQVLPTYREVERFSTALVNAASVPVLRSYLTRLEQGLGGASLAILQNSGGTISAREAADEPVRVLLSGPAGGVVGAARAAREAGLGDIVTLDMGGTSTDVAFHSADGGVTSIVRDARVADHPIAVPTLDLHTIGCGGGSIVYVDKGGILHVGPRSAGADPGPVCYGRGDEPTVTDAHVLLGHVRGEGGSFMDGALALDTDRVHLAFEVIGKQLGVAPTIAAQGVLDVARAAMRRALGVKTMQRGSDPAHVPLVSFGGAGGLSAAALAKSLGMPGALIPAMPGV
ncbi:MAG: N-methylhydantoinase A, partial [Planctomycetota bacterium]